MGTCATYSPYQFNRGEFGNDAVFVFYAFMFSCSFKLFFVCSNSWCYPSIEINIAYAILSRIEPQ